MTEMRSRWSKTSEVVANISIVVVAAFIVTAFLKNHFAMPGGTPIEAAMVKAGDNSAIRGVRWNENPTTLVLALNRDCKFCAASMPFYRRLVDQRKAKHFGFVAVMPHPEEESAAYLKANDIAVDRVVKLDLSAANIYATPTILLVNKQGAVTNVWRGQLDADKEKEVLNTVAKAN